MFVCLSISRSIRRSTCLVCLPVLSVDQFVCLSCLSISLSAFLSVCLSIYLSIYPVSLFFGLVCLHVCQTVLSVYFDGQTDKTADRLTFSVCQLFDLFARQLIRLFCLSVSQSVCRSVWCLFFRLPLQNGKLTKAEFVSWMRRHPLIVDSVFQHSSIKDKQFNTGLQVSNELGVSRAWKELCMINSNNDL